MTATTLELGEEEKLGQFLRNERTKKGIFLSEISEKTCVRTYYLESIEEGEFDKLPPNLIARGFVRAYANYIGIDADAAAQQFNFEAEAEARAAKAEEEKIASTLEAPHATTGVINLLEGAFFWLIPRRKKDPIDLCDFMDQIEGTSIKERKAHP